MEGHLAAHRNQVDIIVSHGWASGVQSFREQARTSRA